MESMTSNKSSAINLSWTEQEEIDFDLGKGKMEMASRK